MSTSGKADPDAQPPTHWRWVEPGAQFGVEGASSIPCHTNTPGTAVVGDDTLRQSVETERAAQPLLHRLLLLVSTGFNRKGKAAVVVQDGEGVAPGEVFQEEVSLKVHLPELVGTLFFEALHRLMLPGGLLRDEAVAVQDARNGGGCRDFIGGELVLPLCDKGEQAPSQLAPTPGRTLGSKLQDGRLDVLRRGARAAQRSTRAVRERSARPETPSALKRESHL